MGRKVVKNFTRRSDKTQNEDASVLQEEIYASLLLKQNFLSFWFY